jgi:hypothetical protein
MFSNCNCSQVVKEAKFSLRLTKIYAMKTYEEVHVYIQIFLTSVVFVISFAITIMHDFHLNNDIKLLCECCKNYTKYIFL